MEQYPQLLAWVHSWSPCQDISVLTPEDWFVLGNGLDGGFYNSENAWIPALALQMTFLWAPDPAATSTAIDELALSLSLVACPYA